MHSGARHLCASTFADNKWPEITDSGCHLALMEPMLPRAVGVNNRTPNNIGKSTVPQGATTTTITNEAGACKRASSKASAKS
jgi:hypothetical protein